MRVIWAHKPSHHYKMISRYKKNKKQTNKQKKKHTKNTKKPHINNNNSNKNRKWKNETRLRLKQL